MWLTMTQLVKKLVDNPTSPPVRGPLRAVSRGALHTQLRRGPGRRNASWSSAVRCSYDSRRVVEQTAEACLPSRVVSDVAGLSWRPRRWAKTSEGGSSRSLLMARSREDIVLSSIQW